MVQYIIRRILIAIPVLLGVTILNFGIINLAPGNPAEMFISPSISEADVELKKEQFGLNEPLYIQYFRWLGNVFQGDFGYSYSNYEPVTAMLVERIGPTLILMGSALIIAYLIAIPIGIISAVKQYSWIDYVTTGTSFLGISIPNFFLGLGLIYVFSVKLGMFPTGGMNTLGVEGNVLDTLNHLILPAIVLATAIAGNMVRYVRSSILEVLGEDYLRTARSKGLHEFVVVNKHALKNALIPIITVVGLDIPLLVSGAVITEQVFQWPGIGQLMIQSIMSRDYPTLMALTFIAAIVVLVTNLVVDILYSVVNPRIKFN